MVAGGFLFCAVAGYLVGVIGSSSNPISGITLCALILAALLMLLLGLSGPEGVAATLGVAAVVCCATGIAGDMIQDLKIGELLGGTPWRMEVAEIVGVVFAASVMVVPMAILHAGTPGGIGGQYLPAPQAGLMAMLARGILSGEMAWPLILVGMAFSLTLVLVGFESPMLVAVGMYLPYETTFAIAVGGLIKWTYEVAARRRGIKGLEAEARANVGLLLASGLVAGEALTGVLLAGLKIAGVEMRPIYEAAWPALLVFALLTYILVVRPLKAAVGAAAMPTSNPQSTPA
jgi:putative OPT family oligopeptide transporter